jgi:cobalamin synthase
MLVGLAIAGAWRFRGSQGVALLVAFIVIRTALLTQLQTVEPRYTVICIPMILALAALAVATPASAVPAAGESALELHNMAS